MSRMAWEKRGKRKGAKRLPESLRQFVIARDRKAKRGCFFRFGDICEGIDPGVKVEVHHVVDAEDGGSDEPHNLATACKKCHTRHSAQVSQERAVAAANDWKRKPEKHPGVLD